MDLYRVEDLLILVKMRALVGVVVGAALLAGSVPIPICVAAFLACTVGPIARMAWMCVSIVMMNHPFKE